MRRNRPITATNTCIDFFGAHHVADRRVVLMAEQESVVEGSRFVRTILRMNEAPVTPAPSLRPRCAPKKGLERGVISTRSRPERRRDARRRARPARDLHAVRLGPLRRRDLSPRTDPESVGAERHERREALRQLLLVFRAGPRAHQIRLGGLGLDGWSNSSGVSSTRARAAPPVCGYGSDRPVSIRGEALERRGAPRRPPRAPRVLRLARGSLFRLRI
jgi:hypothetical protein